MIGKALACSLSFCSAALAQDTPASALTRELVPIWEKHAVVADGMTNPQAIPYGIAMERVFWRFERAREQGDDTLRGEVRLTLPATESDVEILAAAAAESRQVSAEVRNDALEQYDTLCRAILDAPPQALDALSVAERFTAIQTEQATRLTAHYREIVSRLSPAAAADLESYVDANIRVGLRWGPDLVGLALEVPQAFLSTRKESCERRLKVPVQERLWRYQRLSNEVESEQ